MINESEIVTLQRQNKRLAKEIELLRQVVSAYEEAVENVGDPHAWMSLGTAKSALKHHDDNTQTIIMLEQHLDGCYDGGDESHLPLTDGKGRQVYP